ncbi:MAG: hypothetical protein LUP92_03630 [Methanomicrobiales archaeon]|nr:hypothetical protein [Methanomicrobiales archaeon]
MGLSELEDLGGGDPRGGHGGDVVDGIRKGGIDVPPPFTGMDARVDEEDDVRHPPEDEEGEDDRGGGPEDEPVIGELDQDRGEGPLVRDHLGDPHQVGEEAEEDGRADPDDKRGDICRGKVRLEGDGYPCPHEIVPELQVVPPLLLQAIPEDLEAEPLVTVHAAFPSL